ncbi:MAG TPA: rhomboid family intramembrane serine protease [Terriglobia bacterium]|nr:rhomboid family intramembrane serine protease [Terriglobia bacterium]
MPRSYGGPQISFGPPFTGMVRTLCIITSAVFLVTYVPAALLGSMEVPFGSHLLGLVPAMVVHGAIWQLATYLFLHGGWFHIIFNLFALWMFGYDLEQVWGTKRFLFYFFMTGIGGALFNVLLEPNSPIPVIGNSAAVYGILLAFGMLFPDRPIFLWFVVPIKAKWFVLVMGLIEFWASLTQTGSGVAHLAHLGGMLFGFFYVRSVRGTRGRGGPSLNLRGRYDEWRRARLRRKFESYMRKHDERQGPPGGWVN